MKGLRSKISRQTAQFTTKFKVAVWVTVPELPWTVTV